MGEVGQYPHGTFCWVDLETTDVPAAKTFYAGLFGWDMEDLPSGETTYTMYRLGGKDVAAIYPGPGPGRPQSPPHWNSYIAVTDLELATSDAKGLGASMIAEPFDVMDTGCMAVIQDATGAVVNLWEPKPFSGARLVNEVGAWSWNELVTPDIEGAKAFYATLLGWDAADVSAGFPRASFTLGRFLIGGSMFRRGERGKPPGGRCLSEWPTWTRPPNWPGTWADRSSSRRWASPWEGFPSSVTQQALHSPSRRSPPAPFGALTAPERTQNGGGRFLRRCPLELRQHIGREPCRWGGTSRSRAGRSPGRQPRTGPARERSDV
jgi:predicted enzyme related to lactoylglutathione lyase